MSKCCCEDIDLCAHSGANCCKHDAILSAEGYTATPTAARIAQLEADLAAAEAKLAAVEAVGLLTPEVWCALLGARVVDPDGWRDGTREWTEPISRGEFDSRLRVCTIDGRGYPDFLRFPQPAP